MNSAYLMPPIAVLAPKTMSIWTVSKGVVGISKGVVVRWRRWMVDTSPRSTIGSLSVVERLQVGWQVVGRCLITLFMLRKPRHLCS